MKRISKLMLLFVALATLTMACSKETKQEPAAENKAQTNVVLENLQTAYNGESNANAKYEAFAKKADEEGYKQVAVLFRAAAQAEKVHAGNLAEVIKKMGGTPTADIKQVEVKSTKENLQTAIDGETYEFTKMYPEFLETAKKEKNLDAMKAFNFSLEVEKVHAKFYTEALNNLDNWKKVTEDFFVCPVCGFTERGKQGQPCPICATPEDMFVDIK
ncbi:MAG: rubrerythrin family protein [Candidatus Kapaibacteriota bacterium]